MQKYWRNNRFRSDFIIYYLLYIWFYYKKKKLLFLQHKFII